MNRRGTIFTYSVVHSATEAFKSKTPYVVAIINNNQQMSLARIEGYSDATGIDIGIEVEIIADDKQGNYLCKFI